MLKTVNLPRAGLAALASSFLLAACGGGGGSSPSTSQPQPQPGPTAPPTAGSVVDTPKQTSVPAGTYTNAARLQAFNRFNEVRQIAGLGLLRQQAQLDVAAQGHSDYIARNAAQGHDQNPAMPGFTGADPWARAQAVGYTAEITEVQGITPHTSPAAAHIDGLMSTPYHRMGMLNYRWDEVGVGISPTSPVASSLSVFKLGSNPGQGAPDRLFVIWPINGATAVRRVGDAETPNPIPENNGAPYGYTVSLQTHELRQLSVASFTLTDAAGNLVNTKLLHHTTDTTLSQLFGARYFAALIGRSPLQPNTTYTARFIGAVDGQPVAHTWSFATGASWT